MKKVLLFSILFLALATFVNAQEKEYDNRDNKPLIGAKFGLSYSNVYGEKGDSFNSDEKLGFTGGAFMMIPIGKRLGIEPEILITQKGFQGSGRMLGSPYSFNRTSTFLEIPILVAIKSSESITVLAGPQFAYLLKQRDEYSGLGVSYAQEQEFKNDDIRRNILGIVAGLDFNLKHFIVSARIGWDVLNNKANHTSETPRYKNSCTQVSVGYKF